MENIHLFKKGVFTLTNSGFEFNKISNHRKKRTIYICISIILTFILGWLYYVLIDNTTTYNQYEITNILILPCLLTFILLVYFSIKLTKNKIVVNIVLKDNLLKQSYSEQIIDIKQINNVWLYKFKAYGFTTQYFLQGNYKGKNYNLIDFLYFDLTTENINQIINGILHFNSNIKLGK